MKQKTIDKAVSIIALTLSAVILLCGEAIAERIAENPTVAAFMCIAAIAGTLIFVHTDC